MSSFTRLTYYPENPYVFNEHYFRNTTDVEFKDTTFYIIFRVSFAICTLLGLISISMNVFLVTFKTPALFKPYAKMLLMCAFTDFLVILGDFLCQSVSVLLIYDIRLLLLATQNYQWNRSL
jgi:hypothetical protein